MDAFVRLLHVGAGVIWAGGAFMTAWFLLPAAKLTGPAAGPFMGTLTSRTRLTQTMSWSGIVAVVAGGWIWFDTYRLNLPDGWRGMALAVGAVAGLVALGVGHGVQSPNARKMARLSGEMAAADGPPDPDLVASVNALRERMGKTATFLAWALAIGVAGMALGGA